MSQPQKKQKVYKIKRRRFRRITLMTGLRRQAKKRSKTKVVWFKKLGLLARRRYLWHQRLRGYHCYRQALKKQSQSGKRRFATRSSG